MVFFVYKKASGYADAFWYKGMPVRVNRHNGENQRCHWHQAGYGVVVAGGQGSSWLNTAGVALPFSLPKMSFPPTNGLTRASPHHNAFKHFMYMPSLARETAPCRILVSVLPTNKGYKNRLLLGTKRRRSIAKNGVFVKVVIITEE